MSDKKVVVYSSASGGTIVQKKTTEMVNIVQVLRGGKEVTVVWCDAEPKETREFVCFLFHSFSCGTFFALFHFCEQQVWGKSGKKGVYPLLFVNDEFLADVCILLSLFFSISTQTIPLFFHHMFFSHIYTV